MNDMEKRKLWLRYSLAHDKMVDNKKPCIESFPKSNGTIRWNQTRYGVFADDLIKSGVIIEEVPALVLHTTVEDINTKETFDQILASVCIKYPDVHEIFNELGHPIIVPMGNFFAYKQGTKPNAEYIFDRTFNIVTIRSTRPIEKNEDPLFTQKFRKFIKHIKNNNINMLIKKKKVNLNLWLLEIHYKP